MLPCTDLLCVSRAFEARPDAGKMGLLLLLLQRRLLCRKKSTEQGSFVLRASSEIYVSRFVAGAEAKAKWLATRLLVTACGWRGRQVNKDERLLVVRMLLCWRWMRLGRVCGGRREGPTTKRGSRRLCFVGEEGRAGGWAYLIRYVSERVQSEARSRGVAPICHAQASGINK